MVRINQHKRKAIDKKENNMGEEEKVTSTEEGGTGCIHQRVSSKDTADE